MAKTIADFMTEFPHSIGQEQPLARAAEFMRKYNIRHLPVLHGGELMGVTGPANAPSPRRSRDRRAETPPARPRAVG